MTEFRHYCRNPRCKSKLPAPVENVREAFCARGCYRQFYRHRCLVCEQAMPRNSEQKQLCGKKACRQEFRALLAFHVLGRYHSSSPRLDAAGNPITTGSFGPGSGDRPWRQVAGPEMDAKAMHLATLGGGWAMRENAAANRRYGPEPALDKPVIFGPGVPPLNLIGGYRFPGAPSPKVVWGE